MDKHALILLMQPFSIGLWIVSFIFMVLLMTKIWKRIITYALIFAGIGWLCCMFAGFTGMWYIGWFAWTPFLSGFIFIRYLLVRIEQG